MRRCCVRGCRSNFSKPYVSVFTFPKDPVICKLWLKNIGRPDLKVHDNIGVCIKHFEKHCISGISSAEPHRKKITVKHGSVPTIFEDVCSSDDSCRMEEKVQSLDNITRMQSKSTKSPFSSVSGSNTAKSPSKQDAANKASVKSPKKVSSTTDRPIIAVIKAEDLIVDNMKSPENMDEDNDCIVEQSSSSTNSFSLPSPYKNLPSVSVCLKEEDRVPVLRELKGVKRSPSTGSNSSTGSSEAQKSAASIAKRRKIEKPAPVVIGRQNDCYCWACHRENIVLSCIACPRAYHGKCAGEVYATSNDWVCPECQRILAAENVDTRSSTLAEISLDKLGALLKLSLNKMKQRAPIAFHQPVSLEHYPLYLHYVIHPMDFSLLEKNIKQKVYGCTEAFLSDVKWIAHNSCVFNGTQHPLSTNAKNLVKSCDHDMQEIEVCPDCFVHSVIRNKYWFSEVCRKPHPLVWAKLKGFPYWPAKVVRIVDGNVDARFFGAHDRAWVPVSQCYHLSKEMPTTSKPKKKGNYEVALDELNVHVHLIIQKFGSFEYAPYRTSFNPQNKFLMYHGIDIDKAAKEDISFDTSASPSKLRFHSPEKENRFAAFMESENEKFSADESKPDESQPEISPARSLQMSEGNTPPPFQLKDRKPILSLLTEKVNNTDDKKEEEVSTVEKEKKSDTVDILSKKKSETISDSDQLRKLELALERIKGYVSLGVDSEKENGDAQSEENEEKNEKENASEEVKTDEKKKTTNTLSPILNKTIDLPIIETSNVSEVSENVNLSLEATKKTDSFFLKLNETIESCKAKLGISEIIDDLSSDNESAGDENASRSDEDEEDEEDTSASEAEEENSSVSEDEEAENMEASEEELDDDNEIKDSKMENGSETGDSGGSDSEDEDSKSESSRTDIEACDDSQVSQKKSERIDIQNVHCEDSVKELSDANESSLTNPDMQMPEVTIDETGALEIVGGNSSNDVIESGSDSKENTCLPDSDKLHEKERNSEILSQKISDDPEACDSSSSGADNSVHAKNSDKGTENNLSSVSLSQNNYNSTCQDSMSPIKKSAGNLSPTKHLDTLSPVKKNLSPLKRNNGEQSSSIRHNSAVTEKSDRNEVSESAPLDSLPCKTEPVESNDNDEEEDDDIFICNSPQAKPKTPPVIVIDDDQENEESSVSDTFAIKTSPHSSSAESLVDENSECKTDDKERRNSASPKRQIINGRMSRESVSDDEHEFEINKTLRSKTTENSEGRRKRKLRSEDSSDDEIQVVTPLKKSVRTGAIRTFNKAESSHNLNSVEATNTVIRNNREEENQSQMNTSSSSADADKEDDNSSIIRPEASSLISNLLKSPVIDTSNLSDKDKEILFLKSKLNCVLTAYQIQSWKCTQEREELRHNMNLIIMEMRACLESDKKQAIESLSGKFEQEKLRCIEETKKKQWCAFCHMESRYACCWNTSYCSFSCQKKHFNEHRSVCTQLKSKNPEHFEKQRTIAADSNENKKLIIVNMKPSDSGKMSSDLPASISTQHIPASKPQIQVVASKSQLQMGSSASSVNPIQFVLAPLKSAETAVVTTTSSTTTSVITTQEQNVNLDSAQIISNVRNKSCDLGTAINLLKKKNQEAANFHKKKEESKKQKEPNLEEVYFPSPPKVTFEGYDSVSPDPNIVIEETDDCRVISDSEIEASDKSEEIVPEQDVVLSDTDDVDNEMVSIGHGIEVKAKFLNKCLVYGKTAKKLTRCLVDVIFTDTKLLAACSAFGQKSNVTKLTRAALPARKVAAIIDFVSKRFPDATRSEIVLAINMKCKEARVILSKLGSGGGKNITSRRSLAREREDESDIAVTSAPTTTSVTTSSPIITTVAPPLKSSPNVVCIKSSNSSQTAMPFSLPKKTPTGPNIFRCSPQILIRPKPVGFKTTAVVQTPKPPPKRRETIRDILSGNMNWPVGSRAKDGAKLVMLPDTHRATTPSTQPMTVSSTTTASSRPYIIIGPHVNAVRQPSSVQHPVVSNTSPIRK